MVLISSSKIGTDHVFKTWSVPIFKEFRNFVDNISNKRVIFSSTPITNRSSAPERQACLGEKLHRCKAQMGDFSFKHYLRGFGHFSRLNAGGAYINFSNATGLNHRTNSLEIGIEAPFIQIMGMADIIADHWFFSTNCTFF